MSSNDFISIVVTGAAGQIGYSLVFNIIRGDMFGTEQKVRVVLMDIEPMLEGLKGLKMEIEDSCYPLVQEIVITSDPKTAFTNVDYAVLVGGMPRKEGMQRVDLLRANAAIFKVQGKALNDYAKKTVKVLVVANPANTNALIALLNAPNIPPENFSCLTRLDHNRAKAQIAMKANVNVKDVHNIIVWGNHSLTIYPDTRCGYINLPTGKATIANVIKNEAWLQGDFVSTVQVRGAAVISARKLSSAASAAKAITDHMHDWALGTPEGEYVSMGVHSDGSYGVPVGVIFSYPVTIKNGVYSIVQGLPIDQYTREKIDLTTKELVEEKESATKILAEM
ncbi:malate dehydrogenase [Heterostelium album PN500]|uniref:Malate dehydrogenase n=1 Tax=Heterostelium pallidum (strain ATCC 26659 / Pp 5 / PN500) TaxID=670386 RepID=D3B7L8_HETP5|nr:malate dehydrogenase [Heterostelium album PN500]EFA82761.1 malate dehydrogenase [Heterostelium album PN500]|eukprot:XP_020434878.1 malate dehydrogenase [Heterostelium album PN500]